MASEIPVPADDTKMVENQADRNEARILCETGVDARIADLIEPIMTGLGFRLVRVRLFGQNGLTLQIMAERPDGTMSVEDCEALSRAVSPVLDVEDPIERAYHLEISSPGIDRPLVRKSDFARWQGHLLKCETSVAVEERRRFRGRIGEVSESGFVLIADNAAYGESQKVMIPFAVLSQAKLILTDDLIRDALKADKQAKAARTALMAGDGDNDNIG